MLAADFEPPAKTAAATRQQTKTRVNIKLQVHLHFHWSQSSRWPCMTSLHCCSVLNTMLWSVGEPKWQWQTLWFSKHQWPILPPTKISHHTQTLQCAQLQHHQQSARHQCFFASWFGSKTPNHFSFFLRKLGPIQMQSSCHVKLHLWQHPTKRFLVNPDWMASQNKLMAPLHVEIWHKDLWLRLSTKW